MKGRKGFTLIELMIVVVIVAILAAIIIPLLLSRVEKSKYSEGKAIAGQIATAVRAYVAEQGTAAIGSPLLTTHLGFKLNELDGKYFFQANMLVGSVDLDEDTGQVSYIVTLSPNARSGLADDLVLTCNAGNEYDPTFTVAGIEY